MSAVAAPLIPGYSHTPSAPTVNNLHNDNPPPYDSVVAQEGRKPSAPSAPDLQIEGQPNPKPAASVSLPGGQQAKLDKPKSGMTISAETKANLLVAAKLTLVVAITAACALACFAGFYYGLAFYAADAIIGCTLLGVGASMGVSTISSIYWSCVFEMHKSKLSNPADTHGCNSLAYVGFTVVTSLYVLFKTLECAIKTGILIECLRAAGRR